MIKIIFSGTKYSYTPGDTYIYQPLTQFPVIRQYNDALSALTSISIVAEGCHFPIARELLICNY